MESVKEIYQKKNFRFKDLHIYQENTSITGEHYSGKTYFAINKIVNPLVKSQHVKVWVFDYHGLFAKSGMFAQNQIVYYLDEISEGTQCYIPETKSEENFNRFCKLCTSQYNLHVVLDELHNYMSAQRMAKELAPLIRDVAANQGVTYTAIWQRISEGHKAVMSNARHKFLFDFDIGDQERYTRIFGKYADLFLEPESRKFFNEKKDGNYVYPVLDPHSFIYKDDMSKQSEVFNGGI